MQGSHFPNPELLDAAALCGHLVPEDSVHGLLSRHRQELFPDDLFTDLFPSDRGRPSVPGDVVATVMVLQSLEGHSDRDAVDELRTNIAWKAACGVSLADEGFHPTVLTLWRNRLRASERPERIFEAVRAVVAQTGVLKGKDRRALDSTVLEDAVATQDTVTQLISAIRRVRRSVPAAREVEVSAHDYEAKGKPVIDWSDPEARQDLVSALVNDALALLAHLQDADLDDDQGRALGLLALVAGQDVEPGEEEGSWRIAQRVAPDRVVSTVDPEARHARKTPAHKRDGYKAHLAVEPETGIVTAARLTPANTFDGDAALGLLEGQPEGTEVLGDSAYGSGGLRAGLRERRYRQTIKPMPLRPAVEGGFTTDDFDVDLGARTVTCPAGHTVPMSKGGRAHFRSRCHGCELRERCTTSVRGRVVTVNPHHDELVAARRAAETDEFRDSYRRWRPMVERSIAWLVADGNRRVAYRGVERNQLWLSLRVAAINLRRLARLGLTRDGPEWAIA